MSSTPHELSAFTKERAAALGFSLCGVTGALARGRTEFYDWWVSMGFHGDMH